MDIKGLIFDCDGTLVDSMPLHFRAWQRVARRHGFSLPEHRFYSLGGLPTREIAALLRREQGLAPSSAEIAREKDEEYLGLLSEARPVRSIVDVVRSHHGHVPMAVASGGSRRTVGSVLRHLGIEAYFDAIVTSDDVARPKPAPDVFVEAARRIGVEPRHCRAYDDTDLGLKAIRAAGMDPVDTRNLKRAARRASTASS